MPRSRWTEEVEATIDGRAVPVEVLPAGTTGKRGSRLRRVARTVGRRTARMAMHPLTRVFLGLSLSVAKGVVKELSRKR